VLVAACLAAMNGVEIGAILLTGGYEMDAALQAQGGLPGVGVDHKHRQAGGEGAFAQLADARVLEHFRAGSLLVTSADRPDVLVAACLAAMNGVEIGSARCWC
jgi:BioD-like phosphotransacetylase family protein